MISLSNSATQDPRRQSSRPIHTVTTKEIPKAVPRNNPSFTSTFTSAFTTVTTKFQLDNTRKAFTEAKQFKPLEQHFETAEDINKIMDSLATAFSNLTITTTYYNVSHTDEVEFDDTSFNDTESGHIESVDTEVPASSTSYHINKPETIKAPTSLMEPD